MPTEPVRIGIVGCGNISSTYLQVCRRFPILEVVACADLVLERAQVQAAQYGVPRACSVPELLADPAVEIVVNLTVPSAHATVAAAALTAGKAAYNEKPLALERAEGQHLLALAAAHGRRLGGAPDTFLGAGLQTCRALIDDGAIGTPVAASAVLMSHGPEGWHPDPAFFYQPGAGPLFDMGPYYLTALISLLGPVRRVTGSAQRSFPERTVGSGPLEGTRIPVNTPTHVAAVLDFAGGAVATLVTSFDVWATEAPRLEIYGSAGSLALPDPNTFCGPVRVRGAGDSAWHAVPLLPNYAEDSRGLGVADLATGLRMDRQHRAGGALTYHVLDILHAIYEASRSGQHVEIASTCARPAPLPLGLPEYTLDG